MKKSFIAIMAAVLLFALVGCGTFAYNIRSYVDVPKDLKTVKVSKAALDKEVKETLDSLLDQFPGTRTVTEGKIGDKMTAYIYYEGTLVPFDGKATFKVGESGVKGLDEALKSASFKDGQTEFDLQLAADYTAPEFVTEWKDAKNAATSEESKASEESAATEESKSESAPAAIAPFYDEEDVAAASSESETPDAAASGEETSSASESEDNKSASYYAEKTLHIVVSVLNAEGGVDTAVNGGLEDGKEVTLSMRWTLPGFEGGTYNAESEAEKAKKEDEEKGFKFTVGTTSFISGFEEGLKEMSVAANTEDVLHLTFPNPYSNNTALSGEDVDFKVTVLKVTENYQRDIFSEDAAKAAEEFAALKKDTEASSSYKLDVDSAAELKKKLEDSSLKNLALEAILNNCKMKRWPMTDLMKYEERYKNMYYNAFNSVSDSEIASYMGMTVPEFLQNITNAAGKQLKKDLVLYQIAKDNKLTKVSSAELMEYAAANYASTGYKSAKEMLSKQRAEIKKSVILQKALDKLPELVTVSD